MTVPTPIGAHRIGEFARRVGVSPELLRAWERRYGLLAPVRSPGGYRLYTETDARRVARMQHGLESGLSAAQAARAALEPPAGAQTAQAVLEPGTPAQGILDDARARLLDAIERYDEEVVHTILDDSLAAFSLEVVLRELILPALREVGTGWESGTLGVSQEHFASNLIRGRLLALARLWGRGAGPLAVLACVPGESHDMGLLAFGLLLRSHGWRILFLGADTPLATVAQTTTATDPAFVVLTSFDSALIESERRALRRLSRSVELMLSGPGASEAICAKLGVGRLNGDLVAAASAFAGSQLP